MQELFEIVRETVAWFDSLMPIEEAKLKAAAKHNIVQMEECMKMEQVAILQMKGLDKRREELLAAQGMSGLSLNQMIDRLPAEEKSRFAQLQRELNERLASYKVLSEDIQDLLKTNIHVVEGAAGRKGNSMPGQGKQQRKPYTNRKA